MLLLLLASSPCYPSLCALYRRRWLWCSSKPPLKIGSKQVIHAIVLIRFTLLEFLEFQLEVMGRRAHVLLDLSFGPMATDLGTDPFVYDAAAAYLWQLCKLKLDCSTSSIA